MTFAPIFFHVCRYKTQGFFTSSEAKARINKIGGLKMHYSQRMKQYATSDKRMHHVTSSKNLADHEGCNSKFTASMLHHAGEKSSNNRIGKKDCPRTSPLLHTFSKKDLIGCSDVARSESHTDVRKTLVLPVNETVNDHMNNQFGGQTFNGNFYFEIKKDIC